jgi:hypothetical protein
MRQVAVQKHSATLKYDEACRAIAEARKVDEVKVIRDKAMALQIYAKQAMNVELESQACEIRLRAERKAGELLKAKEKAKGGRPSKTCTEKEQVSLHDLGITRKQSSAWQKLAEVPKGTFEAVITAGKPTSTSKILAAVDPKPERKRNVVGDGPLWVWGRLKDFERNGLLDRDPQEVFAEMGPVEHMQTETRRLAPLVAAWLAKVVPDES